MSFFEYLESEEKSNSFTLPLPFSDLADYLGVPHERTYAVGDGYNDIEMLDAAAAGFVPCNGSPEAIYHANYLVRSNNRGAVAHVIEILDSMY